jgi:hypothetical protein
MKEKIITSSELRRMSAPEFEMTRRCIELGTFHLLGIPWKRKIEWYSDIITGDMVIKWD